MALAVHYNENPVWRGRSGGKEYSLHRAVLSSTVGWSYDGYALLKNGALEEFYYDGFTVPRQGVWDIFIDHVEAVATPMPDPDPNDVENFIIRLGSLCERGGEPLQKGEFLL